MEKISILIVVFLANCYAQIIAFNYPSFNSGNLVDWQLNGQAAIRNPNSDQVLRLTPAEEDTVGTAYTKNTIPLEGPDGFKASFSASFSFRIPFPGGVSDDDGTGADGITFTINSVSNSVGISGGGIGYGGVTNSIAVEFDTWLNSDDPNGNHIGVDVNGDLNSIETVTIAPRMNNGDPWYSWVDFNGDTKILEVRLSYNNPNRPANPLIARVIDLVSILGKKDVYVGFTAATGSGWGQHDILSFAFTNQYAPLTTQNPTTGTTINPTTGTTRNPTTGTTQNPTTGTTQNPTTGTTQDPTTGTTGTTAFPCLEDGTYRTQSEGDWGDRCSEFPTGCYRDTHFDECFPQGLTVGCECPLRTSSQCHTIKFTSSFSVEEFLPQLGKPDVLSQDYIDPPRSPIATSAGNFAGQVTALALSLGFSSCDPTFHTDCGRLEDLTVCDNRCEKCKRNNNCDRNSQVNCKFARLENEYEDEYELVARNNKNNQNDGKPQYANCEAFYGLTIGEIFDAANKALGGCAQCGVIGRNNNEGYCVRNSKCRRSAEARNNKNCSRNSNCKRNKNCCCCVDQSSQPLCDPVVLNNCVAFINQAFIFGKTLDDVASGTLFKEGPCDP